MKGANIVFEFKVSLLAVAPANELWLTCLNCAITPVISLDGMAVGSGMVGQRWPVIQQVYAEKTFTVDGWQRRSDAFGLQYCLSRAGGRSQVALG